MILEVIYRPFEQKIRLKLGLLGPKRPPTDGQILTKNFDFRGHLSTFRAENTPKSRPFKAKNNAYTTSEHLQNNFQKVQKTTFLTLKMVKMTLSEGQILTQNFDFRGQISTFRAENTTKIASFKAKNNA